MFYETENVGDGFLEEMNSNLVIIPKIVKMEKIHSISTDVLSSEVTNKPSEKNTKKYKTESEEPGEREDHSKTRIRSEVCRLRDHWHKLSPAPKMFALLERSPKESVTEQVYFSG